MNDAKTAGSSVNQSQVRERLELDDLDKSARARVEPGSKRTLEHELDNPLSGEAALPTTPDGGTDGGTDDDDED